jgi:PAS domain S-box-containing protein
MKSIEGVRDINLDKLCQLLPGLLQVVDHEGRILAVSDHWLVVLGYARAEVVGRPYTDFLTADSRQLVPLLYLPQLTAQGEIQEVECEFVRHNGAALPTLISVTGERDEQGTVVRYWTVLTDMSERKRTETILRTIASATAATTGDAYFKTLVHQLVETYGVSSALITHCADQSLARVRTLAFVNNNRLVENVEYGLAGTPCEGVIGGSVCYFPDRLDELYPREAGKASYLGVPFYDLAGRVLGHVALLDDKPLQCDVNDVAILEIFAARSGAELESQLNAKALRQSTGEVDQLYAQLQDQNRHLEAMVAERTREIEQRRQVAESLRDMVMLLNSAHPLNKMLEALLADATRLLNTESGALFLLDPAQKTLIVRTTRGLPDAYVANLTVPVAHSLVGQAIVNRQPVVISNIPSALNDARVEPDAQYRSVLSQQYQTLLAVPLIRQSAGDDINEIYGCIALYFPERQEFSDEAIHLATAFSAQAALAIENARLREQVQRAAVVEERTRLARELHDSVTQSLYSLTLLAEGWRYMASEGRPVDVQDAFTELGDLGQQALKEMRLLIHELRPPVLEQERLLGALHKRLAAVEKRSGVETTLVADDLVDLPPAQEEALYAIAQEALNNALKHATATRVDVHLHVQADQISLEIKDNGKGFDPAAVNESGGLGLLSMRERAARIGGVITIASAPNAGTTITVTINERVPATVQSAGPIQANGVQPQSASISTQQHEVQHD